jgi:hypothetical protein
MRADDDVADTLKPREVTPEEEALRKRLEVLSEAKNVTPQNRHARRRAAAQTRHENR